MCARNDNRNREKNKGLTVLVFPLSFSLQSLNITIVNCKKHIITLQRLRKANLGQCNVKTQCYAKLNAMSNQCYIIMSTVDSIYFYSVFSVISLL